MEKRILVVDDDPSITRLVKLVLERTGRYEVRTENLGRRALDAAREFRPHLILLDVLMPGMLGSDIAAQLQADPQLQSIKFLFLTGAVTKDEAVSNAGQIGGHVFVAKPFGADELCKIVDEHVRDRDGN